MGLHPKLHHLGMISKMLYSKRDVGPAGISRLVAMPNLFRRFPRGFQDRTAYRAIRPAGASWLKPQNQRDTHHAGVARSSRPRPRAVSFACGLTTERRGWSTTFCSPPDSASTLRDTHFSPSLVQATENRKRLPRTQARPGVFDSRIAFCGKTCGVEFWAASRFCFGR